MPDFQDYTVTRQGAGQARTWRISCVVTDPGDGHVIADLTGGQSILFPQEFLNLSDADQEAFMQANANWLVMKRLGLPT
jgi:hypothetical protein